MPLYAYVCPQHGTFQAFQTIASREKARCPTCHNSSIRAEDDFGTSHNPFRPYYTEAFSSCGKGPIEVRSREQEKALCEKDGFERIK